MPISALIALLLTLAALLLPGSVRAQTYSSASETYAWVSTAGHSSVSWGGGCTGSWASVDDDISAELALGFGFTFGSTSYTTVRVMSNGRLQFNNRYCGNGTQNTSPRTYPLAYPDSNLSRTMRIYGADLDPSAGGSVTYRSLGTAPNRSFVVTWTNVREWGASGSSFNLQVILHESGDWVFQYGTSSNTSGGKAQIGWQLSTSDYAAYSFTSIGALASTAIRWRRPQSTLSGTVFEDIHYGGGAGRTLASSGGAAVSGATVELYNSSGSFVSSTTTSASGAYSFTVSSAGNYHVRVASTTVVSTRSGSGSSLRGVLTYRTTATSGSAVAVSDFVGGTNPAAADPGAGSSGTTFNTSSYVFSAGLSGTAHAVAPLTVTLGTNIASVDFGFSFATVSNVNDSGQGSLRQAITNANTLGGDAALAVAGRSAGVEHLIFMIGNGSSAAGLRSSVNLTSSGVATIAVASALPSITQTLVIDASTQPGYGSTPVVEINGAATAAGIAGLVIAADNCVIDGLAINRFGGNGITLGSGSSGQVVRANHIGTNAAGTSALANGGHGVEVRAASSTIGGSASGDGNLLSGNSGSGVYVAASGTTITANRIGSNAAGSAALANQYGIRAASSSGLAVGGSTSDLANTISGNGSHGIYFEGGNSNATVQGNRIGRNAAGSGALANGGHGVYVGGTAMSAGLAGGTLGGTTPGSGNTIAHNGGSGIVLAAGQASEVAILGNTIHSHTSPGIDLGADGASANDGSTSSTQPNRMTDTPVFAAASFSGATLTVSGYVGSAPGQSAFGGARVELFVSDASLASGSGRTYIGALTSDASGNFSGSVTIPGGVTLTHGSTLLTATATDSGGRTSEFGPNRLLGLGITGSVFEDPNYGGGAGRSMAGAGGVAVAAARVELYDGTGAYVNATTSAADGSYAFSGLAPGSYHLRVVSDSVRSTRTGSTSSLVGVMTYRTDASSGSALAVTDFVGGTDPAAADPGNGSSGTTLNTSSYVFSAGLTGAAHAVAPATLATADLSGVDFGFNFATISNTRNSGQGSLRQAITNANTLVGDAALAVAGRSAGIEHLVFMIPNGSAAAGLRSSFDAFSGGVATLALTSPLPSIDAALVADARTQPGWVSSPVLVLDGVAAGASAEGLKIETSGTTIAGWAIRNFGGNGIEIDDGASNTIGGTSSGAGNVISNNGGKGVVVTGSGSSGNAILGNAIHGNGGQAIDLADNGVSANDGAKTSGQPNLLTDYPVFASATYAGSTLTLAGYVGTAAGQSTFAGARIEVYVADTTSAGNGAGQIYLGALTADASGNFSGTLSVASGITPGTTRITGTATDGSSNTSEFAANVTVEYPGAIRGTVFEDVNYGGGAGRSQAGSGGAAVGGARVELYDASGSYLSATTSAADGSYAFTSLAAASYHVRVVSSSVRSTRSGSSPSLVGVLTYRTTASTGAAVAVSDFVGGTDPAVVDPGNGASGTVLNTTSYAFSTGLSGTAQAAAPVAVGTAAVSGLDFGFNFATVVNTNDSGQGSLRQAITNADALGGDASLAVQGRAASIEHIVFMLPNGTSNASVAPLGGLQLTGGLRSSLNTFSGGVTTIRPLTMLPSPNAALVVDARLQPGWTTRPIVELDGSLVAEANDGLGGSSAGLRLRSGSTVGGLIFNRWPGRAVWLWSNSTLAGNWFGLNAAGTAAAANGSGPLGGGSVFSYHASSARIGGTSSADQNLFAGVASGAHIHFYGTGSSSQVLNNRFGLAADGTTLIGYAVPAILVAATTTSLAIGGVSAAQGNVITGSTGAAILASDTSATGVTVRGNAIYGNGGIGIDLGNDGITPNDGAKTSSQPNLQMDSPVITSATIAGTTLSVSGYVGSAAGQTPFAASTVDIYESDVSSANGSGRSYLGTLTADASGNFSGTIAGVTAVTSGGSLTGVATDTAGNSSEFGANVTVGLTITGTAFEDLNYGGGAGRSQLSAAGAAVSGARVELFDASGAFQASTSTAGDGSYRFTGLAAATYHVRVVSGSVLSTRSGATSALVPVLTFRTDASGGTASAVTDHVGGTNPSSADPGNAAAGTTLNPTTRVFSSGLSGTAHAVTTVTASGGTVSGVDFGFNFDTVTNTSDSGQGSLRQAITNAQTLTGDATLAQAGRSAGVEHLVFMLGNGSSAAGLRSTVNVFSGGVATIAPTSALPVITTTLVIDAQTQPGWSANPIVQLNGTGAGTGNACFSASAGTLTLRGFVVNRCPGDAVSLSGGSNHLLQGNWIGLASSGSAASALSGSSSSGVRLASTSGGQIGGNTSAQRNVISGNSYAGIYLGSSVTNLSVSGNYIGTNATGSAAVANAAGGIRWGSSISGTSGITIGVTTGGAGAGNVISGNTGSGIRVTLGAPVITANLIGLDAAGTAALANGSDGIRLEGSTGAATIGGPTSALRNVISGNGNDGIHIELASAAAASGIVIAGNHIGVADNGSTVLANAGDGIDVQLGSGITIGGTTSGSGNIVAGNVANGIEVEGASQAVAILGNSIYGNGTRGIDLANNGVSANDGAKSAGQPNLLMDHPVISSARATGTSLVIAGYVGSAAGQSVFAGSRVEFFVSDGDTSGYGEGRTYLGALTSDASGNFSGTLTIATTLAIGTRLTATATDGSGNTSEFGPGFASLLVDLVVDDSGDEPDESPGNGLCATTKGVCTLRAAIEELNAAVAQPSRPNIAFALPSCKAPGDSGCVIAPASALPPLKATAAIDGSTQPNFDATLCTPMVELDGAATASGVSGLLVVADGSRIRALVIRRFGGSGITLAEGSADHEVVGNRIGTDVSGQRAEPNSQYGIEWRSRDSTIGGKTACDGNLLSGNQVAGVFIGARGGQLLGNRIGPTADDRDLLPSKFGVYSVDSSEVTIGGESVELGNGVAGHHAYGLYFEGTHSGMTLAFNRVYRNGDSGVAVAGSSTQVNLSANAISDNGGLGIDLGVDGVSANTGTTDASRPNAGMNHPVFTGAGVAADGLSMTVYGYVGTGTGQAAFAGARIEIFKAAADATGYGEGQVYLGSLAADANGRFSGSVSFAAASVTPGDVITATATDGSGNTSEFGPAWTSTTVAGLTPAGFDAFDSGTAAGSTSGPLTTRVAGATSTVDVIALNSSGTGLHAGFTGTVSLSWLDARDDSGASSGSCRASWSLLGADGAAGSAAFSNASRVSVSIVPPAAATRVMRLRMSYTSALGSTTTACSGDAFAVIPASLTLAASDGDAASTGTTRTLANTSTSGGVVHRAGRAFTVTATARDALGNLMTGYAGTPTLAVAGCLLPAGCSAGTLSHSGTSAVAGVYVNSSVSYAEVGAISVQLSDTAYAAIDAADTPLASRTIASAAAAVGRFVPDSYALTVSTNGTLATANAACLASGSGATFFGQGLGWTSAPQVTVTALNAAGQTTTQWAGTLMKLDAAAGVPAMAVSGAGSATLASSLGSLTLSALGSGQARYAASATDRFVLDLPPGTTQVSTSPAWTWSLALTDASEAAVSGNPTLTASVAQSAVPFDRGAVFHSGRLALAAAHGDARSGVRQLVQLQRWTSAGWVTMTEDRGCVSVGPQHLAVSDGSGAFSSNTCAAPLGSTVTTQGGRAWLPLPATPAGTEGRLLTRLAGDASGTACTSGGLAQPVVNLNLPWLMAGGSGPTARATWGRANRDAVLRRETW